MERCHGLLSARLPSPSRVGASTIDDAEFRAALTAHFARPFVVRLAAHRGAGVPVEDFMVLCALDHDGTSSTASALILTVTDCVSGIYGRCLGEAELVQTRADAGMAEFGWAGFMRLLASALRGTAGCSGRLDVLPSRGRDSAQPTGGSAQLTLRFQLQAAALICRLQLDLRSAPPQGAGEYLCELRSFVSQAVRAGGPGSDDAGGAGGTGCTVALVGASTTTTEPFHATSSHASAERTSVGVVHSRSGDALTGYASTTRASAGRDDLMLRPMLPPWNLVSDGASATSRTSNDAFALETTTPTTHLCSGISSATPAPSPAASSSTSAFGLSAASSASALTGVARRPGGANVAPAPPKKRAGSLLDPGARRTPRGGANPFQLSR